SLRSCSLATNRTLKERYLYRRQPSLPNPHEGCPAAARGWMNSTKLLSLSRKPRVTRNMNLVERRRLTLVVDDESIGDSYSLECRLKNRYQWPHPATVDAGGARDFCDQLAA